MDNLYTFAVACVMLAIIPGPDILFVITQGITQGKKAAILTSTGLVTGCIFHTAMAAFGVSVIFQQSKTAFLLLKVAGVCYLLYLAYCALRSEDNLNISFDTQNSGFKKGILMNILNPKVILFFIAFLPQFVSSDTKHFAWDMIILGIIFAIISWTVFVFCSVLSAKFNTILMKSDKFGKYINKFATIAYIVIALLLII